MSGIFSDLPYVLLLATATASVVLAAWYYLGDTLVQSGYFRLYDAGIRLVACLFLLPIAYLALGWSNQSGSQWGGKLFEKTPAITWVYQIFWALWFLGAIAVGIWYLYRAVLMYQMCRKSFSCEHLENRLFERVCEELKVPKGKVRLLQNYSVKAPFIRGVFHPQIILPADRKEYYQADLRIIFLHELMHYKQRDMLFGKITALVTMMHFFNPLVWWLRRKVTKWRECACDARVCRVTRNPKEYFECLLHVEAICEQNHAHTPLKAVNDKSDLLERIEFMDKLMKVKKKPIRVAVMLVCGMLLGSSVTVAAASGGAAKLYVKLYEMTDVAEEVETQAMPKLTEYEDEGPAPGVLVEESAVEGAARAIKTFTWSVHGNAMKTTSTFYVKEGQQICVDVYQNNHTDKNIRVGIIKPSGYRLYVYSSGHISHNFTASESGYYKVFVENTTSVTIDVDGSYNVY